MFATENGWLEYDPFFLGWPIFRGCVSSRKRGTPENQHDKPENSPIFNRKYSTSSFVVDFPASHVSSWEGKPQFLAYDCD